MILQLKNISKGYGKPNSKNFRPVLDKLDLSVGKGDKIAVVGPSGSGKTTLLNIIGAMDSCDQGEVIYKNTNIKDFNRLEQAKFRNQHIGFVFQLHHLMPQLNLLENVLLPLLPDGRVSREQKAWAEHLIQKVGLWDVRKQKPGELSGGECQRTAVVRALVNRPELILADEPTGALDEENAEKLSELLVQLSEEGNISMITVTHSVELASRMDYRYTLSSGRLRRTE